MLDMKGFYLSADTLKSGNRLHPPTESIGGLMHMENRIGTVCVVCMFVTGLFVVAVNLVSDKTAASTWNISTVDPFGAPGDYSSIALDGSDYPHIGYTSFVGAGYNLNYARWDGSMWNIDTVDSSADVGAWVSIAVDSSGHPHMTYLDGTNGDLKYAEWTGSTWNIEIVDSAGDVGYCSSLVLNASGYPHVSYLDLGNLDLKYAIWTGAAWNIESVDSAGDVGWYTSLALDIGGNAHISYLDSTNVDLKYAEFNGITWDIQTVDSTGDVGKWTSLEFDSLDYPHISYYDTTNDALKYAEWNGSAWLIETIDSAGDVGLCTSLELDGRDFAHISYFDIANVDLRYTEWTGSSWSIETIDSAGDVGWFGSMALDSNGLAHISYGDWTNFGLKYAREEPNISPGTPSTPSGPGFGLVGVSYSYSTAAVDPNNDAVMYTFDWGDGNTSETGYNQSGIPVSMSHDWSMIGSFQVKVMANDVDGASSAWSIPFTVTIARPPDAPMILAATPGDSEVGLSWAAPSSDGGSPITNYRIFRGTSPGSETFLTMVGNVLTYLDAGLVNGQTYYYNLTARNAVGEGPSSNEANAIPMAVPEPPTGLVATAGNGQVALSWLEPSDDGGSPITNYTIWRGTSSDGETLLNTINDTTDYVDTGLTNGQTYYYMISARNSIGDGPNSTEVSATPATTPSEPLSLQATAGDGQVTLAWSAPASDGGSPITAYRIYRGTTPGGETLLVELGNVLAYTDTGLVNGQNYNYAVKAANSVGEGPQSEEVSATPNPPPPSGKEKSIFEEVWFWLLIVVLIAIIAAVVFLLKRRKTTEARLPESEAVLTEEKSREKGK